MTDEKTEPTATVLCADPTKPLTPTQHLERLRAKVVEYREYQEQATKESAIMAKWFEGKADAYDECADILDYLIMPHVVPNKDQPS